jgi:hypothetical protein
MDSTTRFVPDTFDRVLEEVGVSLTKSTSKADRQNLYVKLLKRRMAISNE